MKKTKMFSLIACLALFAVSFVNINDAFAAQEISISGGGFGGACKGFVCQDIQGLPITSHYTENGAETCCAVAGASHGFNKL